MELMLIKKLIPVLVASLAGVAALSLATAQTANAQSPGAQAPSAATSQAVSRPPTADFFRQPLMRSPNLSPDGKRLAMLVPSTKGDDRLTLAVASVDAPTRMEVVAHMRDADVRWFSWINNNRLVFDVIDTQEVMAEQDGSGLYAINADGSDFRWLIARKIGDTDEPNVARRPLGVWYALADVPGDGSDDVLVVRYDWHKATHQSTTPLRLNTYTRALRHYEMGSVPDHAAEWVFDASPKAEPRALLTHEDETDTLYWREAGSKTWTKLVSYDTDTGGVGAVTAVGIDAQGQLYVNSTQNNPDRTHALFRYSVAQRKLDGEPLVALKGFDFTGHLLFDYGDRTLLGVSYTSDAPGVAWLDPGMKAMQQQVDKLLPGTNNLIACTRCRDAERVVVSAESDRQSPVYFLYTRATNKLELIGAERPWLANYAGAEMDFHRISARDGMQLPVYVTRPAGKGPWPTVVLVHGGPYVRGPMWGWSPDAQFLASRGYAVVEPAFRGTTGYGDKLNRAGWKQWGLAMQDDVTDATHWAIKQGIADAKRIAIAGASYGGYATMMGLVKEPDLYRAGINWVGVTDIDLMYSIGWSDGAGSDWQRYGMRKLVGDPDKDAAQLVATSPLKQASRITKPVLMAYGKEDLRVPLPHGSKMRDALEDAGKVPVEWVVYEGEGHNWMLLENNVDFWNRVERFLGQHLK